jgi:hypothetical protein
MADTAGSDPETTETLRGVDDTEGAGCMPAILAATVLMGIVFFIAFGFSAWLIFQKRGDLASRTIRATIIPELEQSRLDPAEKTSVVKELTLLADDIEGGMYENWQAGGIMQRLINMPLMRWGDLEAVAAWAEKNLPEDQRENASKQVSRFFRAVELDRAVARDIHEILAPVATAENAGGFVQLRSDLNEKDVAEVVLRCKLVADRAEVPDQTFDRVSLTQIVRRQIEAGGRDGAK